MNNYAEKFNELARHQSQILTSHSIRTWILIDPGSEDMSVNAKAYATDVLKIVALHPIELVGKCFGAVTAVSLRLMREGIKHTVTIGDVLINGESYFGATKEKLISDMQGGSSVDTLASAHAWITLENGVIVDLTIKSSLAHKYGNPELKWTDAVFISNEVDQRISHHPIMLGTEYQFRAIVDDNDFARSYFLDYSMRLSNLLVSNQIQI